MTCRRRRGVGGQAERGRIALGRGAKHREVAARRAGKVRGDGTRSIGIFVRPARAKLTTGNSACT